MIHRLCRNCGCTSQMRDDFCRSCGGPLLHEDDPGYCTTCGSRNRSSSRFCMTCGAPRLREQPDDPPASVACRLPETIETVGGFVASGIIGNYAYSIFCRLCTRWRKPPKRAEQPTAAETVASARRHIDSHWPGDLPKSVRPYHESYDEHTGYQIVFRYAGDEFLSEREGGPRRIDACRAEEPPPAKARRVARQLLHPQGNYRSPRMGRADYRSRPPRDLPFTTSRPARRTARS